MARIKVTGYIDTEDMLPGDVDFDHPMGITDDYYSSLVSGAQPLPVMEDLEFELETDQCPNGCGQSMPCTACGLGC